MSWASFLFRLRNATEDKKLYSRQAVFVPTDLDIADARELVLRTEEELRQTRQYVSLMEVAIKNRAEFDVCWTDFNSSYDEADEVRLTAKNTLRKRREARKKSSTKNIKHNLTTAATAAFQCKKT